MQHTLYLNIVASTRERDPQRLRVCVGDLKGFWSHMWNRCLKQITWELSQTLSLSLSLFFTHCEISDSLSLFLSSVQLWNRCLKQITWELSETHSFNEENLRLSLSLFLLLSSTLFCTHSLSLSDSLSLFLLLSSAHTQNELLRLPSSWKKLQ